jgi:NADH-quinone oxidoreductase subunit H
MQAILDFWATLPEWLQFSLLAMGKALAVIGVVMPIAGLCSLAERKVSAWIQGRIGPNRATAWGIGSVPVVGGVLQRLGMFHLLADSLKMLFKEDPIPGHVNKFYYVLAPIIALIPALMTVTVVPFGTFINAAGESVTMILANVDVGILLLFAISSLGVYSTILAGWASNSKYPFLGGIRASAQMISYEIAMGLSILPVFLWINTGGSGTLSLSAVVNGQTGWGLWYIVYFPICALIFLVALFAETNRAPFDMPESESELVGGFHTEYGAFKFGLFFAAEYAHMVVGSGVFTLLFLGGWHPLPGVSIQSVFELLGLNGGELHHMIIGGAISAGIFISKVLLLIFFFMWVRWTVPRFRYDQVMKIGWKMLLPLAIANLIAYALGIAVIDVWLR